jgi:hypothetical protein
MRMPSADLTAGIQIFYYALITDQSGNTQEGRLLGLRNRGE